MIILRMLPLIAGLLCCHSFLTANASSICSTECSPELTDCTLVVEPGTDGSSASNQTNDQAAEITIEDEQSDEQSENEQSDEESSDVTQKLKLYKTDVDNDGLTVLHWAAVSGDVPTIKVILENRPELLSVKDNDGRTALHIAANNGKAEAVYYFTQKGLSVDALDSSGATVLHHAALGGNLDVVRIVLFSNFIHVWSQTATGKTPIHVAASEGYKDVVELLLTFEQGVRDLQQNNEKIVI